MVQTKREAGMDSANRKHLMELMDETGVEILTKTGLNMGHSLHQMERTAVDRGPLRK